jgi:cytochrome c peroxidase
MRSRVVLGAAAACLLARGDAGRADVPQASTEFTPAEVRRILQHSPLPPLPPDPTNAVADDPRAARLGQFLFFETRLSGDGRLSCASCHDPRRAFTDGRAVAAGARTGRRNTPALWNVAYNRWFFWDGRAGALWSQAVQPLESPDEMAGGRLETYRTLRDDRTLRRAYERVFGPLGTGDNAAVDRAFANVGKAIAAYERRIVSRRSPFDVFAEGLRDGDTGRVAALPAAARRGLKLFVGRGQCRTCHSGPNFTDKEFHDIGVPPADGLDPDPGRAAALDRLRRDPFGPAGAFSDDRHGEAANNLSFLAADAHAQGQVKTPSLRNVALTAPYMHQGQLATLQDVVRYYSTLEGRPPSGPGEEDVLAPLNLTSEEQSDLTAFLESLTDAGLAPSLVAKPPTP